MKPSILYERLESGKTVYVYDDFEDAAVRLVYSDGETQAYLKHRNHNEVKLPQSYETICEIILGGEEISKQEYDRL